MPREIVLSPAMVVTNPGLGTGGRGAPAPKTSPMVFTKPGTYTVRVPPDVATVTVEVWGAGAGGGGGPTTGATGANGGGGGAHAKVTIGAGLYVPGGAIRVTVGKGGVGTTTVPTAGGNTTVVNETVTVIQCAAAVAGAGGVRTVSAHAGVTSISQGNGTPSAIASDAGGTNGGAAAGTGGGTGGGGGPQASPGTDGVSPGGGGGGGGLGGAKGGNGAGGKVILSW